ncbi:SIR2 family protein [Bacillus mycoides]|uniref:SIR2 family protein n=1 Tax=Bacillus mycoides TaxID=1405 RepID=UPI0025A050B0|nr:SIR2 family protein [Bacillus mycoides]MDM5431106.1 SIR2 family protein [Bacillus mycoides]
MSDYFVETSIRKIKEASKSNKLVVFVGAGVSANSGIPTWGELIAEMSKDLGEFDNKNSTDTYLKIPQFYYNERGEKEYFEKLNEVFFSRKYKTNPLHNEIFKLNPTHIITTNYDTLLEEAAIEGGHFYHVVKHDLDLPYDNLNKTIIKMHGDFENRNIVLKEDDYLNYSSNFTLIENYLKSLIATNTVLFIGYSVNDPNFNLIFQWVKSIVKNHFQPAYLIESSKEYSRMEHHYYKNRGINIIYYDEINSLPQNNIFNDSNWRGNKLYDVIKYCTTFNNSNGLKGLEYIYDKLRCFEKLNFIMPEQIIKSLNLKSISYDLYGDKTINCLHDENILTSIFSKSEQLQNDDLFKKIRLTFNKANIDGISKDKQILFYENEGNTYLNKIINEIIASDSLIAQKNLENPNNLILDRDYFSMLKQAFSYYESDNFLEAYKYYKSISLKSFSDKEYLIYYISEFNRKHVGDMLTKFYFDSIDPETKLEIEELDLEEIYLKLPYKERKSLEFVKEIQNFNLIYKVQNRLTKEVEKLKKTKLTIKNGGFSINSALDRNFHIITNIWLFIKANYLCLEKYSEVQSLYKRFIEGIIASYCTKSENNSKGIFSDLKVDKIDELNLFTVYIMVTKLKTKDLEAIFNEYHLRQINIEPEALEYLMQLLDTVLNNIMKNKDKLKKASYFCNLLTLLSKLNLESNQINMIAEKPLLIFNEKMHVNEFKYVNKFIVSGANRELISQEIVVKYLVTYLKIYQQNNRIWELDTDRLYTNLTRIYTNSNEYLIDTSVISIYLELINSKFKEKDYVSLYKLLSEIILPIIKGITDTQQNKVLDIVQNLINEIEHKKDDLQHTEISFYYSVLIKGICSSNEKINIKILEDTVFKIENQKSEFRVYPDSVEINLIILTELYRNGCIQKKEIQDYLDQFKGFSEYFDLVFNNMDLNLTDINLIANLNDLEIEEIMNSNNGVKEQVYKLLDKNLFENQSRKMNTIFEKLYSKKFT